MNKKIAKLFEKSEKSNEAYIAYSSIEQVSDTRNIGSA